MIGNYAMSSNVVINIYRNPLEPEEDPPTWCCMPQVSGMAVSVCLIICFELGTLAAVNVLPDLHRYIEACLALASDVISRGCACACSLKLIHALSLITAKVK